MGTHVSVAGMGMDIHRHFSQVSACDAAGRILWRQRLDHHDREALRRTLARWPTNTSVVLEGSFGWSWLADELALAGLRPRLASSRKAAAWRDLHGQAKCDRTDADLLSRLACASAHLWEVWLPPPDVRQQREWLRGRMALVRQQTGLKNRVHAILHRHGLFPESVTLFSGVGRRWLQRQVVPATSLLPPSAQDVLRKYLQVLDHLRRQIASLTRVFRRQVMADPVSQRLRTLPGVQWILAYTLRAEIGQIERFPSARHLASYSLLAPRAHETGDPGDAPPRGRHVGHQGRRTLQWAYVEAAHGAVYRSPRLRNWFAKYTSGGRRQRGRGYLAIAHRLCQASYVIWKKEQVYREDPAPRPGSRRRHAGRARPVKGQPADAMVPVTTG